MSKPKNAAAVALGRLGGASKSKAKAQAARANGKKGGRPRADRLAAARHTIKAKLVPAKGIPREGAK